MTPGKLAQSVAARGSQGAYIILAPLPSLSLPSRPLGNSLSRNLKSRLSSTQLRVWEALYASPSEIWGEAPAANDFGAFEDLETLLMTSKMCFFYAHELSFHAHPCLYISCRKK